MLVAALLFTICCAVLMMVWRSRRGSAAKRVATLGLTIGLVGLGWSGLGLGQESSSGMEIRIEKRIGVAGEESIVPPYELQAYPARLTLQPIRDVHVSVTGAWPYLSPGGDIVLQSSQRLVRIGSNGQQHISSLPKGWTLIHITDRSDYLFIDETHHQIVRTGPDLSPHSRLPFAKSGEVTSDRDENVYVWLTYEAKIEKFTPSGQKVHVIPSVGPSMDNDFAFDLQGNLWLSDSSGQSLLELKNGYRKYLDAKDENGNSDDPDRQILFSYPTRILPDVTNNLWIINGDGWRANDITIINRERTRFFRFDPLKAAGLHLKDSESGKVQVLVSETDDTVVIVDLMGKTIHYFKATIDFGK